ncbi:MAG: NAD-glutamate dehydrogenase, partial [Alphaproteobacteria bacterium]|nr:NAD-glutamate dehydrogenase [Alphaproteobacteria bacterium]
FSDVANAIAEARGFWLGDAFASGGSNGYDHKAMGITARGAWISVQRHFLEMGVDVQSDPVRAIGCGDMSGDVFGNDMLLSKSIELVAAFDHRHIFIDPRPDAAASWRERKRLFGLPRSSWADYDEKLISKGGGVFPRSAKSITISKEAAAALGTEQREFDPESLINAILKSPVDLIWFGGIGTYIKAEAESDAQVGDPTNDGLRVSAPEVRARVIGEGANLGITQAGRIEFALHGGRINTDFIDNSAGVDCSDHEVNIKILLSDIVAKKKLNLEQRNKLLVKMTDEVAALVLRDNYQQSQSLSLQQYLAKAHLGLHSDLMRAMEKAKLLKRSLEGLPDDESIARLSRDGQGLTRPELAILTSYAKIMIYNEVLASSIPDDPMMEGLLFDYFPKELHKYSAEIKKHKLRREIIATQIVNTLVNRMGPEFVQSRMSKTGAAAAEVIKAFMIVLHAYDLPAMWQGIEALDNKVPSHVQVSALNQVFQVAKRTVTWYLRFGGNDLNVAAEIEAFKPGIELLKKSIGKMAPEDVRQEVLTAEENLIAEGVPPALASQISTIKLLSAASDIISITRRSEGEIKSIADVYFSVGERLGLDWLRFSVGALVPANGWQARVMGGLTDDFYIHQAALTSAIIATAKKKAKPDSALVETWFDDNSDRTEKITQMVEEFRAQPKVDLDMLVLVSQRIGQLVHQAK